MLALGRASCEPIAREPIVADATALGRDSDCVRVVERATAVPATPVMLLVGEDVADPTDAVATATGIDIVSVVARDVADAVGPTEIPTYAG